MGSSAPHRSDVSDGASSGAHGTWRNGSFLSNISEDAVARLLKLGSSRTYSHGDPLIYQCDETNDVFVLTEGVVKVTVTGEDDVERLIDIQLAGDTVGEIAFADGLPRSAKVVADGTVRAVKIKGRALADFLRDDRDATVALGRVLTYRDRRKQRRYLDMAQFDVRTRVARVLADLVERCGVPAPEGVLLGVSLTQSELATLVGLADASIHKVLRSLRDDRVLHTTYRQIVILDEDALRRIAQFRDRITDRT